jgi:lipopolysaccharide transport system ATP-binding protein
MQAGRLSADPRIYSPLYMTRGTFDASPAAAAAHRKFIVIRDLRDTLISWYFSLLHTHSPNPAVDSHRLHLSGLNAEDGLLYLIAHPDFSGLCSIPASWLGAPDPCLRYEQLIEDPHRCFARIFEHCELDIPDSTRRAAVDRWLFQNMASRRPGEELRTSHMRKGISGDWRNHFTPAVASAFKLRFGDLLIRFGYEAGGDW